MISACKLGKQNGGCTTTVGFEENSPSGESKTSSERVYKNNLCSFQAASRGYANAAAAKSAQPVKVPML